MTWDLQASASPSEQSAASLLDQVGDALAAVRGAEPEDCGRRRADALRLVHRWASQQDRADITTTLRRLDGWAAQLNSACRRSGGAGPVARVGARLQPVRSTPART